MPTDTQSSRKRRRAGWTLLACVALLHLLESPEPLSAEERLHRLRSPRQSGETLVQVFTPDGAVADQGLRALYVLPVEAGSETRWGDPVEEVRRLDLANRHGLVVVLPTFSALPWYADHPSDPRLRQEEYLLHDVLPLVEREYAVIAGPEGRLLVGFSKSGWGAWSLLLRHPDVFGRAAAWDAPLMQEAPDRYGMGPVFGSQENFEAYRITTLVRARAGLLRQTCRLVLTGYAAGFRAHHSAMRELLDQLRVPHAYRDGPQRKHHWQSGWLGEAVELLVNGCGEAPVGKALTP